MKDEDEFALSLPPAARSSSPSVRCVILEEFQALSGTIKSEERGEAHRRVEASLGGDASRQMWWVSPGSCRAQKAARTRRAWTQDPSCIAERPLTRPTPEPLAPATECSPCSLLSDVCRRHSTRGKPARDQTKLNLLGAADAVSPLCMAFKQSPRGDVAGQKGLTKPPYHFSLPCRLLHLTTPRSLLH